MSCQGKLLLAIVSIFCHSVFLLFVVRGSVNILWIRWRYAAILCSVGWLEVKLIVVSVVVGLRNMSMSIAVGCRISSRSRKFMVLFCSCVGVKCRLGCTYLVYPVFDYFRRDVCGVVYYEDVINISSIKDNGV